MKMLFLFPALLLLVLVFVTTGCGSEADDIVEDVFFKDFEADRPSYYIDPELQPYLDEYVKDMEDRGVIVNLDRLYRLELVDSFKDLEDGKKQLGVCWHRHDHEGYYGTVEVLRGYEDVVTKAITYHELGHCLHKLEHSDEPKSLMYSTLTTNPKFYEENWSELVEGLVKYLKEQLGYSTELTNEAA